MKHLLSIVALAVILTGCGNSGGDSSFDFGPQPDPGPEPNPAFSSFVRDVFGDAANDQPREINDLEFTEESQDDDFADLLL